MKSACVAGSREDRSDYIFNQRFKIIVLILAGAALLILAWGLIEPYFIDEKAYAVAVPNLPEDWVSSDIAVISDFQVGMWWDNVATIRRIIGRIVPADPEAVLILGDFIYHGGVDPTERIETVVRLIEPLRAADLPVIAVLGNHDYSVVDYDDVQVNHERAQQLTAALEEIGVHVLENESTPLTSTSGSALHFVGSGSYMANLDDPRQALAGVPADAPRLALMHNPMTFERFPADSAPLAVAGHTHGGQFRLPFTPAWTWVTYFREEEVHADGWAKNYGAVGNRLYVNRGIGFSLVPLRFNCPPEVTWFTLTRSDASEALDR